MEGIHPPKKPRHPPANVGDVEKVLLLEDGIDTDGGFNRLIIINERRIFLLGRVKSGVTIASSLLHEEIGQILRGADGRSRMRQAGSDATLPLERVLFGMELDA